MSVNVFYEDIGSGDPPLVFVHGLGTHEHFGAQIAHFAAHHRVIAPDLPGFGQSAAPRDRAYSLSALAGDVGRLCTDLELHGAVLVGHSMGAAIALQVAAAQPELVAALVLLDPVPIVPLPVWREGFGMLVAALEGPHYRDAIRQYAEARMFRPTDDAARCARIVDDMCATPQHVVGSAFASLHSWDGAAVAAQVRAPVLLVTAGDGIPSDMARTRELLPALELGRTVGAGHFAHLLVPEQVNAMIEQFLATLDVAATAA